MEVQRLGPLRRPDDGEMHRPVPPFRTDRGTGTSEGRSIIREGTPSERAEQLEVPEISIDPMARRIVIRDRGETFGYEFGQRRGRGGSGGLGWSDLTRGDHDAVYVSAASAAEVMAVCRDGGRDREVAAITLAAAGELGHSRTERSQAARLAGEVRAGVEGERVSLRAVQARIVALLVSTPSRRGASGVSVVGTEAGRRTWSASWPAGRAGAGCVGAEFSGARRGGYEARLKACASCQMPAARWTPGAGPRHGRSAHTPGRSRTRLA